MGATLTAAISEVYGSFYRKGLTKVVSSGTLLSSCAIKVKNSIITFGAIADMNNEKGNSGFLQLPGDLRPNETVYGISLIKTSNTTSYIPFPCIITNSGYVGANYTSQSIMTDFYFISVFAI